ncbi:hypothetical protein FRC12_006827 [Ceratobasidium sp. 428]|nr:hypothetical protein FRC12_006827 [Ceratobasidium sp. 428]
MSSKQSKRSRFRTFLDDSSEALKAVVRPRSPRPSSSSALKPNTPSSPPTIGASTSSASVMPSSTSRITDTSLAVLKSSLRALNKAIDLVPTFKSVMDTLAECVDHIPAAISNRQDFDELALNIAMSARGLEQQLKQANPALMVNAIRDVLEEMDKEANDIKQKQDRTAARAYIEVEQDIDHLTRCYRRVEVLFRQLHSIAILSVWRIVNENLAYTVLAGLAPAKMAIYDSSAASQLRRRGCTPNTRQLILRELQDWASDPNGARVFWMNGMAGTGKTTIAYTFCRILETSNQLAANFFCSRSLPECRDVNRIIPTIASQLSHFYRPMRDVLSRTLEKNPDASARGVMTQFEMLVSEPLREVKHMLPTGLPVVVIDALDECSDHGDALLLLNAMLRFVEDLPIKFFVTCRPDSALLIKLSSQVQAPHSLFHLHDIEGSLVQADIEIYLADELSSINATPAQIHQLANQSGALFIFAATAVRYIGLDTSSIDHQMRLDILLGLSSTTTSKVYKPLDLLYAAILTGALEDENLEPWDKENIRLLLHTVVCVRAPLSLESLAWLLQLKSTNHAQRAINPLRSVVHVDERSGLVSTLHASFPDYLFTAERSCGYFCDKAKCHELLSRRCFETMSRMLHFNICDLRSSYVLDRDVPGLNTRLNSSIPPHLFYACQFWSEHMVLAAESTTLPDYLSEFLQQQIMFWTEVINLKRVTRSGVTMLADCYQWMKVRIMSSNRLRLIDTIKG